MYLASNILAMSDARQERGRILANDKRIKNLGDKWLVPSQTAMTSVYVVDLATGKCSCADHETRSLKCKHQWAAEFVMRETVTETVAETDGTTKTTETTREVRVKYTQNWTAYNAAQTTEKEHVGTLLRALCDGIVQPKQARGRPRLALADVAHSAAMKVYVGMSGRRASTDVRECEAKGLIGHAPHFNSTLGFIDRADVTELLKTLVEESAAPLKAVESRFAVDSTGFATSTYARWYDHKYGRELSEQRWVKCHAMVGVTTNVITAVEVTESNANDSPELPGLVATTAQRFDVDEVSADKAYVGHANFDAIEAVGAVPYIPFKSNNQGEGPAAWRRAWHTFSLRREEFLRHYHARSNVETTFSAVKRLFGGAVRAKLPVAQRNEVLLKCLVYNVTCLVHGMYELGIEPTFGAPVATMVLQ
jgi:transposase